VRTTSCLCAPWTPLTCRPAPSAWCGFQISRRLLRMANAACVSGVARQNYPAARKQQRWQAAAFLANLTLWQLSSLPPCVPQVHPTCGPTQDDDIPGIVRYRTYEVLRRALGDARVRWAYLPYSMHMAGPREAIQHILIRKVRRRCPAALPLSLNGPSLNMLRLKLQQHLDSCNSMYMAASMLAAILHKCRRLPRAKFEKFGNHEMRCRTTGARTSSSGATWPAARAA